MWLSVDLCSTGSHGVLLAVGGIAVFLSEGENGVKELWLTFFIGPHSAVHRNRKRLFTKIKERASVNIRANNI